MVIASKFLPRTTEEIKKGITMQQHIYDSCNASLKNLDIDYLDLYIYHMWDYHSDISYVGQ